MAKTAADGVKLVVKPDEPVGPKVPVVYRVNLRDTATFFAMQHFAVRDKDVLFVSNSPVAEFQRFIGVVAQAFIPISTVDNALNRN